MGEQRFERRVVDGQRVVVMKRRRRDVEQTINQFEPAGRGGQMRFWQVRVREAREARGLTQEQMAFRCQMSVSGYRRVETAARGNTRLSTLERIAFVLGVDLKDLL